MRITLISHSDLTGGAAVVTTRLMHALADQGADTAMLVSEKRSDDPRVHLIGSRAGRAARFLSERLHILAANGLSRRDLFKTSIATRGYDLSRHPLVRQADAIIIGWINQGTLSLDDIRRIVALGRPVAWVQHDMWAITGICHHALGCGRFTATCGSCPFIHLPGLHRRDLSTRCQQRKQALYRQAGPGLHIVAVSSWLAREATQSTLLRERPVTVIPNPFPVGDFYTRPLHGLPERQRIIMGAARLDDPIKGLDDAILALNTLADSRPDIAARAELILFGALRDPRALHGLRFPHRHLGPIADPALLRELYAGSTVVLSTSRFETLPGTIIEGMASGCTPVSYDRGGQLDIIEPGVNGHIATYRDPADTASALARALDTPFPREAQRATIEARFAAPAVARAYLDLLTRK